MRVTDTEYSVSQSERSSQKARQPQANGHLRKYDSHKRTVITESKATATERLQRGHDIVRKSTARRVSVGPERHISNLFCFYIIVHRVCVRLEVIAELRREILLYEPVYDRDAQLFNALKAAACIIYREGRELIEQGSLERPFALLACGAGALAQSIAARSSRASPP